MEKTIRVVKEIKVTVPDEKIAEHLKDFNEVIDKTGDVDELFKHIAWNIAQGNTFVEGVGRVKENDVDFYSETDEYKATDINCEEEDSYCEEW